MKRNLRRFQITRRQFAFWFGFGLFNLAEALGADSLDDLAAASMRATEKTEDSAPNGPRSTPEHWAAADNNTWRWFERENLIDGHWKLTGITAPIHKQTGERYAGSEGYLDDDLVPPAVRRGDQPDHGDQAAETAVEADAGQPNVMRRARHGRPPSRWLRSLHADELRIWLKTIDVPEADVSGMTFWEHLTRDHSFDPRRIAGLAINEQAKLHAAAHFGY